MWRNKKQDAAQAAAASASRLVQTSDLDLAKYDLDGLRSDIGELISLRQAVRHVGVRALTYAAIGSTLIYLVMARGYGGIATVFFMIAVIVLALIAGAALALFSLLRKRVGQTTAASSRVIDVVALMHRDYLEVKSGAAQVTAREVGTEIAQQLVLPAAFGAADQATALAGPIGFLLSPALGMSQQWVERAVVSALGNLSDEPMLQQNGPPSTIPATHDHDVSDDRTDAVVTEAASGYADIQGTLETIVRRIGTTLLAPALVFAVVAAGPLVVFVGLVWLFG